MTINQDFPVLDGIASSWADINCQASPTGGQLITLKDIAKVTRKRTVSVGEQIGASGGRVTKHTTGSVKYELAITFYRDGYNLFIERLAALAPTRGNQKAIRFVTFLFQVHHTPVGSDQILHWKAKGCFPMGDSLDHAEGDTADQLECSIGCKEIVDVLEDGTEVVYL